ncbi:Short-chain dehydrogenase [Operophtera brumata]|uniref:Short-chain dehydrogenase n=1 Tax=Operophtera brumata TaxID=104452 RepID=A0A0L7L5N3_OPEBR|nr:Short-chain dehydrogenase [Operophtera brumata]
MEGKVVIVTGANAGIGFHTAQDLARRGARVILACRDHGRGTAARASIVAETGNNNVVYQHLDLSSLKSVRQFATNIIETEDRLDVLVNNAGIYGFADTFTEDEIIQTMQQVLHADVFDRAVEKTGRIRDSVERGSSRRDHDGYYFTLDARAAVSLLVLVAHVQSDGGGRRTDCHPPGCGEGM